MAQTLQSVSHALRVLLALQRRSSGSVKELADSLGLGASTVHRLLSTLLDHGFVEQVAGRRYRLGVAMTQSPDAASIQHCVEIGYDTLQSLREETDETVHISVLDGTRSKFVSAIESPHMMRVTSRVGLSIPAHTSAAGKVLLAKLSLEVLHELYPYEHLTRATAQSGDSRAALELELEGVRRDGYGRNFGESEEGLVALAVPIRRPSGIPICSLTVTGPTVRFHPEPGSDVSTRELELVAMLNRHARQIERRLKM